MKKYSGALLFLLFASLQAKALSDIEISGEVDVTASVWQLPTGERGNSAFNVPSLFLDLEAPLKDDNLLVLTLEGSEQEVNSEERFEMRVREAYLDLVSEFSGMHALRVGLIPQTWQEAQYEQYGYRFLGTDAWAPTEKWKYLNYSDLGFSFMSQLPQDWGEWAFNLANGEGANEKEKGSHKEAALFARFTLWSPLSVSFNYVRGSYDKYSGSMALKERIQALLEYQKEESWLAGLELLLTKDPADALSDYKMAEGVDVTDFLGQSVDGRGASFYTVISTGPKAEVLLRYDYLDALASEDGKDLQTVIVSLGYQVTEDIKAALAVDHTRYAENYAPGVRDRSKVELAAQVLF
ncbi:MAG: hypothetical protein OM95_14345 [Bdellovibrio sp. ArHS]|uniref:hypothetical protein n=1 Tax=Bdellovibrio sp. ArHS TaxID=1569284 RepID=UPI000583C364|nr:hypothetical protein [Bdellovibrio sp. ArHS]KHD87466.1 MAG: hypothetical protein OM95_14345 [Bdellovibrio sp. ArHS]